jgi:hypothetical protein
MSTVASSANCHRLMPTTKKLILAAAVTSAVGASNAASLRLRRYVRRIDRTREPI